MSYYEKHVPSDPYPYYSDRVVKSASSFEDYPQDVIILVRAYFRAKLLFEDVTNHNQVIISHNLFARDSGEPLDYHKLSSKYMPDNPPYQLLSPEQKSFNPNNDSSFTPGATEIIYVRPVRHRVVARHHASNSQKHDDQSVSEGTINIAYKMNQGTQTRPHWTVVNSTKRLGRVGQPFHRSAYLDAQRLPQGYQLSKQEQSPVIKGNQVTEFKAVPQNFDVAVEKKVHHVHQVTGKLVYKDQQTGQVKKSVEIHGAQDSHIDYNLYENSKYIPSGYRFDSLSTDTGHFLEPDAYYVILIKKVPKHVSAWIVYKDISNDNVKKMAPVSGPEGSKIDFNEYTSAKQVPHDYRFVKLASNANHKLVQDAKYVLYIKSKQAPIAKARVLYQDINNNQIKLSKVIKGRVNQSIAEYTAKDSQHIPDGYHFVDLVSNHDSNLKPNAVYIVLIGKDHQRPRITGQIVYQDIDTGRVLHTISVTGKLKDPIKYSYYTNSDLIPNGYSFVKLDAHNSKYLEPNVKSKILVRSNKRNDHDVNNAERDTGHEIKLPQTGHNTKDIGSILMALGSSLSALGHALGHHKI